MSIGTDVRDQDGAALFDSDHQGRLGQYLSLGRLRQNCSAGTRGVCHDGIDGRNSQSHICHVGDSPRRGEHLRHRRIIESQSTLGSTNLIGQRIDDISCRRLLITTASHQSRTRDDDVGDLNRFFVVSQSTRISLRGQLEGVVLGDVHAGAQPQGGHNGGLGLTQGLGPPLHQSGNQGGERVDHSAARRRCQHPQKRLVGLGVNTTLGQ